MADMNAIIQYADAREPGFASKIKGAPEQDILSLESKVGKGRLPLMYREYLRHMGMNQVGLDMVPD